MDFINDGYEIVAVVKVSIPSRGFWFFEARTILQLSKVNVIARVSIPSRGFWFFEDDNIVFSICQGAVEVSFNPLAGILVF